MLLIIDHESLFAYLS